MPKVYLKKANRYWTGHVASFKDGSNIFFVTTEDIFRAKDFQDEDCALDQLEWWCGQCGGDPNEWSLEFEWDKIEKEPIKTFCQFHGNEYIVPMSHLGEWKNPKPESEEDFNKRIEYNAKQTSDIAQRMYDSIFRNDIVRTNRTDEGDWINREYFKPRAMQRTFQEICIDADNERDNGKYLYNLKEEILTGTYTESEKGFALDHIQGYINKIRDKRNRDRIKNSFDED